MHMILQNPAFYAKPLNGIRSSAAPFWLAAPLSFIPTTIDPSHRNPSLEQPQPAARYHVPLLVNDELRTYSQWVGAQLYQFESTKKDFDRIWTDSAYTVLLRVPCRWVSARIKLGPCRHLVCDSSIHFMCALIIGIPVRTRC